MRDWIQTTFAALEVRPFRILSAGTLLSFIAFFMATIAQNVVAFELEGTNSAVGLVVFGQGITMAAFGPMGGALADRFPKRRMIATGQLVAASTFAAIALLITSNRLHVAQLVTGAFVIGTTFSVLGPARMAYVVDIVPEARRGNAMVITQIANTAARVLGPVLAGAILAWPLLGAAGAYSLMALCYVTAATLLFALPKSVVRPNARDKPLLSDLTEGLRYVWQHAQLRRMILFFALAIAVGFPHVTVLPGLLENHLGRDAVDIAPLAAAAAIGAFAASIGVARYADSEGAEGIYSGLAGVFGLSLIGLGSSRNMLEAGICMFFAGIGSGGFQALNGALVARATEPQYIGRVLALTMVAFGAFGLMALPYGLAADRIGERATLWIMGGGVLALTGWFGTGLRKAA